MKKLIFNIENRGNGWIYHWFCYMISGLRFIGTNKSKVGPDSRDIFNRNSENIDTIDLDVPIYITIPSLPTPILSYQLETLELIKDVYTVIDKSDIKEDDIVINNYGEFIVDTEFHIAREGYEFLRNLFQQRIRKDPSKSFKNKKYYLSRSKTHTLLGNAQDNFIKRRQIVNEIDLSSVLSKLGIETIFLEDYSLEDKFRIFQEASLIISPNSGGLFFCLFSSIATKIVEINSAHPGQISRQYEDQCRFADVPYFKYKCSMFDMYDNMFINIEEFLHFLIQNKII